jgi:hypothetical protein
VALPHKLGILQKIIKMIKMPFYFLLINKKYILIKMMGKLFIVEKMVALVLDVVMIYI